MSLTFFDGLDVHGLLCYYSLQLLEALGEVLGLGLVILDGIRQALRLG